MSRETGPADKRASKIARQIEADIVRRGWTIGESLGSERDLQQRYEVSRSVLREAVRLVEHHQVARMRRGPNGGLLDLRARCRPGDPRRRHLSGISGHHARRSAQRAPGARTAGGLAGRRTDRRGRNRQAASGFARGATVETRPGPATGRLPHRAGAAVEKPCPAAVHRRVDPPDDAIRAQVADRLRRRSDRAGRSDAQRPLRARRRGHRGRFGAG